MDLLGPAPRMAVNALGGLAAGLIANGPGAQIDPARAPGPVLADAPGPGVDYYVPPAPPPPPHGDGRIIPFLPAPEHHDEDKWLVPIIVVVAVSVFLGIASAATRWARRMGPPIRG